MPRYYFNIGDSEHVIRDDDGVELADTETARKEAADYARLIIIECVKSYRRAIGQNIEIADATGAVVGTLQIRDAMN